MKTHTPASTRQPSMKNTRKPSRILATSAAVLLGASLMLGTAQAYNPNFWDVNGVVPGFGLSGTWDNNTTANWNNVTGTAAPQTWINPIVNNNAVFQGTTGLVTVTGADGTVLVNSMILAPTTFAAAQPLGYVFTGAGALAFGGTATIQLGQAASPDSTTTMNTVLTDVAGSGITVSSFLGTATSVLILSPTAAGGQTSGNTFTGPFNVNSGTVQLSANGGIATFRSISGNALNIGDNVGAAGTAVVTETVTAQIANTVAVTVNNDGVWNVGGSTETVASIASNAGASTAVINLGGGNITTGGANTSTTYAGAINGAGAINKAGTGTWTLSGTSNYTGVTNVTAGVLNVANANALGAVDVGAGTANGTVVANNATLQLSGGITVGNESLTLIGAGTGAAGQEGALVNLAGSNTFGGRLIFTGATTISNDAGASTFTLSNTSQVTGAFVLTLNSAAAGGAATTNVLAGGLNALTGLVVNSTNTSTTWTLTGNNGAFAGPITVNSGTLVAGSANAFGNGLVAVTLNNTGIAGNLDLNGNSQTIGSLTGAASTLVTNGAGAAGPATLTFGGDNTSTIYNGVFADTSALKALSITKTGTGTFTMGGTISSTYNGLTTVAQGTLLLNGASISVMKPTSTGYSPVSVSWNLFSHSAYVSSDSP